MTESRKDLYTVLEVSRDADADAIKKAYKDLARANHPDLHPGDVHAEERFKAISEAYSILSDADRRRNYDEFGDASLQSGFDPAAARRMRDDFDAQFGAGRGGPGGGAFSFGDLDDMLTGVFGRGGRGAAGGGFAMRGADVEAELELDFIEAARGGEKRISVARPGPDGRVRPESMTVRIPPGVADGGVIRLRGKGGEGLGGGPSGDLHARIRVRPHPVFRREGRDLYVDLPITVSEAVLGAKVDVPTLDGRAEVQVPPGTDGGAKLRLRGKGIPSPGGGTAGDLYAVVRIRVPRDLDDEAKSAVAGLRRFEPDDPRSRS